MKAIIIVILTVLAAYALLMLTSLWDSKQGAVDVDSIKSDESSVEQPLTPSISIREPTSEELEDLVNGNITKDELIQSIVNDAVVERPDSGSEAPNKSNTVNGTSTASPSEDISTNADTSPSHSSADTAEPSTGTEAGTDVQPPESSDTAEGTVGTESSDTPIKPQLSEYEQRIAELIAEAYILRGEYIITLEAMYSEAEADLAAIAGDEDNGDAVSSLVSDYLSRASALERQCDSRIDAIVNEMNQLIRENNGDSNLSDTLIETYINEKATKKAWYLERLEEKGLISS